MNDYLSMKDIKQYILEIDANTLPSDITVNDVRGEKGGTLTVFFGKNGWGLSDEFAKIDKIIHKISHSYNIYLVDCKVDNLDDVYTFTFQYDNKNFE